MQTESTVAECEQVSDNVSFTGYYSHINLSRKGCSVGGCVVVTEEVWKRDSVPTATDSHGVVMLLCY